MAIYNASLLISASNSTYFTNVTGGIAAVDVRALNESWISSSALVSGSNTFVGSQIISGNVDINGSLTASLQTGYLFVGDGSGKTQAVATSSIVTNINTGSFATTGSNTFTGQQRIDSPTNYGGTGLQMISSSITFFGVGGRINFPNGGYFLGNPGDSMNFTTDGVGQQFSVGDSGGTPTAHNLTFRNDTPNGAIQFNNLSGSTTFQNPNGDFAVTASAAVRIQGLVYPNTDGTAGQALITNGSGTLTFGNVSVNTGSFATTGSNTFYGDQNIYGTIQLSGNDASSGSITFPNNAKLQGVYGDQFKFTANDSSVQFLINSSSSPLNMIFENRGTSGQLQFLNTTGNEYHSASSYQFNGGNATFQGNIYAANLTGSTTIDTGSFLTTGSLSPQSTNTGNGLYNFNVSTGGDGVAIALYNTGSDASGSMKFGITDPGNPFIDLKQKRWFQFGANQELQFGNFTSSYDNGILLGSYYSQGKIGLLATSGSLGVFNASGTRPYYTNHFLVNNANSNTATNLIFINNSSTVSTILSGSNNILSNPGAGTAGFTRYVGGNGNIHLGTAWTQISSSMAFSPSMNRNIGNMVMTMRGPVSSSTWTINDNVVLGQVNIGTTSTFNAEKLVSGLSMLQNVIPGAFGIQANQSFISSSSQVNANVIVGTATLNLSSSAIVFNNNFINDTNTTITNAFYTGSLGNGTINVVRNNFAGQGQQVIVSGSVPAGATYTAPVISDNAMFGSSNIIYVNTSAAPVSGGVPQYSAVRNLIAGYGLYVTGSSHLAQFETQGAAFVGRFNANDGIRNKTGQNVFVVGAGTSDTTRKNALTIDSGSNSYFEGTLNVSGATTLNGNTSLTGSLTISSSNSIDLNVIGAVQVSASVGYTSITANNWTQQDNANSVTNNLNTYGFSTIFGTGGNAFSELGFTNSGASYGVSGWNGPSIYINDTSDTYPAVLGFQQKSDYTDGRVTALTPLVTSGSLIANSYTILTSVSASLNFADDAAAAAGGVPLGGLYRNGNFVMIRLT